MHTCYIFGALPTRHIPKPDTNDLIIAADAGCHQLGDLTADLTVGDFDSLGFVPEGETVIQHPVRKDDTDMLLAVRQGLLRGYRHFVLLGGYGGRLDHTLANLQTLLFLAAHGAHGFLQGEESCAAVVCDNTLTLTGGEGHVSVFALEREVSGVTLEGLDYPLQNAALTDSFPLGVSNAFTSSPARISALGRLLVLWDGDWRQATYTNT